MKKIYILIPSLFAITPLFSMVGCSCGGNQPTPPEPEPEPEASDFSTDPWETVCYYAYQGLDVLCNAYQCKPQDFLGKTRDIQINNQIHKVKVIGTNEDVYLVDHTNRLSALTFQFDTLITNQEGQIIEYQWDDEENNEHYFSSLIHQSLNDETSSEITSVYEMIVASNPWAGQYIRSTYRQVNERDNMNWTIKYGTEKLFLPILSDLFSIKGMQKTDSAVIAEENVAQYYYENVRGSQYSYYQSSKMIGDNAIANVEAGNSTYKQFACLKKEQDYWLCSPYLLISSYAWHVMSDGTVQYSRDNEMTSTPMAIAPCFCI